MEDPKRNWDLEHIYDTEIAPLMSRIIEICKANNLPMFATFVYANGEDDGEDYCTTYVVSAKPQEQKAILAAILLPAHYEWPEEREAPRRKARGFTPRSRSTELPRSMVVRAADVAVAVDRREDFGNIQSGQPISTSSRPEEQAHVSVVILPLTEQMQQRVDFAERQETKRSSTTTAS